VLKVSRRRAAIDSLSTVRFSAWEGPDVDAFGVSADSSEIANKSSASPSSNRSSVAEEGFFLNTDGRYIIHEHVHPRLHQNLE
jgi:hypothetical protein